MSISGSPAGFRSFHLKRRWSAPTLPEFPILNGHRIAVVISLFHQQPLYSAFMGGALVSQMRVTILICSVPAAGSSTRLLFRRGLSTLSVKKRRTYFNAALRLLMN